MVGRRLGLHQTGMAELVARQRGIEEEDHQIQSRQAADADAVASEHCVQTGGIQVDDLLVKVKGLAVGIVVGRNRNGRHAAEIGHAAGEFFFFGLGFVVVQHTIVVILVVVLIVLGRMLVGLGQVHRGRQGRLEERHGIAAFDDGAPQQGGAFVVQVDQLLEGLHRCGVGRQCGSGGGCCGGGGGGGGAHRASFGDYGITWTCFFVFLGVGYYYY